MESLLLSVNVTLPLFIMMALGYVLRCLKVVDNSLLMKINTLNFKVFLPISMFNNIYMSDISEIWDTKTVVIAAGGLLVMSVILLIILPHIVKEHSKQGVVFESLTHSNYSYVGIPVVMSITGSATAGLASIVLAITTPLTNSLSTVAFEVFRGGKASAKHIIKRIITHPPIIGCVLGVIFMLLKVQFPSFIQKPLSDLAKVCTPLALIALGGMFDFRALKGNTKFLTVCSLIRLIAIPAVFLGIAVALGVKSDGMAALLAYFAAPMAVVSFTLAHLMGGDGEMAGQMIVVQSCACIFTMFGWVYLLHSMGFI